MNQLEYNTKVKERRANLIGVIIGCIVGLGLLFFLLSYIMDNNIQSFYQDLMLCGVLLVSIFSGAFVSHLIFKRWKYM